MPTIAGAEYWDSFFQKRRESGRDLDWAGRWIEPFLIPLRDASAATVLELGCGTGNDAARLADSGYTVTAIDVSGEAVRWARSRFGTRVDFRVADITQPLAFPESSFDAVMSNVALHMFPDRVTRSVFAEIARVVRPGGLFLFHVNAIEDRPLRARALQVVREIEPDYVLEETGQTLHFFSDDYLRELLRAWRKAHLELVEITDPAGQPFKRVWRGVAHR
jgi:SAM-dependent methyltransferase